MKRNRSYNAVGSIVRLDPAFDSLVPLSARIEKLAGGFQFTEGPLWFPSWHLWFSDVVGNVVRQWSPDGIVRIGKDRQISVLVDRFEGEPA
jgi:sugar lactone lactonase YvrE